jgi:hypothetical protein
VIDATIDMLRARQDERVAIAGLIAALFCDDVHEAVRRLDNARDAAREYERSIKGQKSSDKNTRALAHRVASYADDLRVPVLQLAERDAKAKEHSHG